MSLCPAQTPGADPHTVGEGEEGSEEGAEGEEEALKEQKPPGVLSSVKSIALAHLQGRKQADSQLIEGQCYGGSNITSRTTRARSSTAPPHPPPPPPQEGLQERKKRERGAHLPPDHAADRRHTQELQQVLLAERLEAAHPHSADEEGGDL